MKVYSASEIKTAYKVTRTMTGVECDVCKKILSVDKRGDDRYFEVTTGHHDWGNDSIDSVKTIDVCPECLNKYVADYFKDSEDSYTAYLDIATKRLWAKTETKVLDNAPKEGEVTKEGHDWW